ncbi:unnamed protein product [Heligmosomoides polygyrus]|uniref:Vps4_C domain-containing protein n=1 Tax=Heligmosomoides polygyrus TaxID=6339 RepID=A0A183FGP5_HELPZ|nr:unnamed protein product [Heligmosomoides polygyrus]
MDRKKELKRMRGRFEEISTVEFPHPAISSTAPTHGPVQRITRKEVEAAFKKMRSGEASGPDDIAPDLWKSKYSEMSFLFRVCSADRLLRANQGRVLVPA